MEDAVRPVCVDTSAWIALTRVGCTSVVERLFAPILLPDLVVDELREGSDLDDAWSRVLALRVEIVRSSSIEPVHAPEISRADASVIGLARSRNAIAVIDDARARRVARRHNVTLTGTLGVLLAAKHAGLVPEVGPLVEALRKDEGLGGFRLSDALVRRVLEDAGEHDP